MIKTIDLTKKYKDKTVVDGLNLEIGDGEIFALLGPNGAGKTTTIKMLCGLTAPTSGDAYLCGYSVVRDVIEVKRRIGVSPQETAVAKNLTALENLEMIAETTGKSKEDARAIYESFRLDTQGKKYAKKLSGGWQRILSIAMAVLPDPEIVFLDEPTLGLDIEARRELWDVISEMKKTKTIVLTTHYLEEAYALADRIGIIKNGKLIELGTGKELMEKYGGNGESFDDVYLKIVKGDRV